LLNPDQESRIQTIASALDLKTAQQVIIHIEATLDRFDKNVNTRLAAEVLMLDLPRLR
jgi:hypothetical protein